MKTEIDNIIHLLEDTFDQQPWYGSSIKGILSDISQDMACLKQEHPHSIIQLVLHMIAWRTFTTQRLLGNADFDISDDQNFPTSVNWGETLSNLDKSQRALADALKLFPPERLNETVPSKRQQYTYYTLLHGIIHHDIYHLGQIAFIKKLSQVNL